VAIKTIAVLGAGTMGHGIAHAAMSAGYDTVLYDVTQAAALLHGEEKVVFADAGYQGVAKREEAKDLDVQWHVAMRPGKRRALDKSRKSDRLREKAEKLKASVRAKVEHPFRVVKQQFGYAKVRYRGLAKNTARLTMLFALSNLWMVRRRLMGAQG
jgi:IS5 family transposase